MPRTGDVVPARPIARARPWHSRCYPSDLRRVEALVFDAGRLAIDGNADFLAEPHLGGKAGITLDGIELDYFRPLTSRQNVSVQRGTLAAKGRVSPTGSMD